MKCLLCLRLLDANHIDSFMQEIIGHFWGFESLSRCASWLRNDKIVPPNKIKDLLLYPCKLIRSINVMFSVHLYTWSCDMEPSNDLIWLLLNHAYSIQIYPLNQRGMDCIFQVPYLRWIKFHYLLDCASTSFGHPRIESLALQVATRFCLPRALKDLRALRQLPMVSGCARNHPNLTACLADMLEVVSAKT